jgi:uncharacterized membrane protein YdjX (TVP38/TMEM64 family)
LTFGPFLGGYLFDKVGTNLTYLVAIFLTFIFIFFVVRFLDEGIVKDKEKVHLI